MRDDATFSVGVKYHLSMTFLPLGDSITWGYVDNIGGGSVPGGYRLRQAGGGRHARRGL